ncbi:ABC transporter permease [Flavitalea sp.]|nr:ABC transporter permease [Flavitalea sp.]
MIKNYFRLGWRALFKSKLISAINIFGLATGLTSAILMIIWVENELSFDTHYKDYERTYMLMAIKSPIDGETITSNRQPYILGKIAADETPGIKSLTRLYAVNSNKVMKVGNHSFYEEKAAYIDEQWFNIFDQEISSGDLKSFFSNPFSVVLTKNRAKDLFGNTDPVGKIISIDSNQYMVRAVVENNKSNATFQYDMFLPVQAALTDPVIKKASVSWNSSSYFTFVKLDQEADTSKVASAIYTICKRHWDNKNFEADRISLLPINELHFTEAGGARDLPHGNKQIVLIFGILAAMILFSACINYVNLTTARAAQRSKEVGIRKLIGARKHQIFVQFLIESILTTVIAIAIALLVVQLVLPVFNNLTEKQFSLPLLQGKFWFIISITAMLVVLLNGIYPALLLSSFKPVNVLKGTALFRIKDGFLREGLVVVQFSFSIALVAGIIILSKQLEFINERDGGFNRSLVFQMPMPIAAFENMDLTKQESTMNQMRESIAEDAAVTAASVATPGIGNTEVFFTGAVNWPGKLESLDPLVSPFWADDNFFRLFDLRLAEGRWLKNDQGDAKNVVINESAVKEFGFKKPVAGQQFVYLGDTGVIVGVVKDVQYKSMHEKIGAQVFKQNNNAGTFNLYVKPGLGQTTRALAAAKRIWNQNLPSYPFIYSFVEDDYAAMYAAETKSAKLVTIFGLLAVSISCLGLLGLVTFSTGARSKEISIRKMLGANALNILNLLSKDFMKLVVIAALIAIPVAYYFGSKWLENFAYKIDLSWGIFGLAGLAALFIAFATISVHVIKAAVANPVKTMRNE